MILKSLDIDDNVDEDAVYKQDKVNLAGFHFNLFFNNSNFMICEDHQQANNELWIMNEEEGDDDDEEESDGDPVYERDKVNLAGFHF